MKKTLWVWFLIFALVVTACSSATETTEPKAEDNEVASTEVEQAEADKKAAEEATAKAQAELDAAKAAEEQAKADAQKAAAEKVEAEKLLAEAKTAEEKAAAEKLLADSIAAEKAAAEAAAQAAAEKVAAEKAAAEKAAAQAAAKVAAEKAVADKAAADKAVAEKEAANKTPVTITVWTTFAAIYDKMFEDAKNAYVAQNPHVTFKYEKFTGTQRAQKVALAKQSNTLPTIIMTNGIAVLDDVHQGLLLPLTDIVTPIKSKFSASSLNSMFIGGNYYMIPVFESPYTLLYNADIFRAAGLGAFVPQDPNLFAQWKMKDFEEQILPGLKKFYGNSGGYPVGISAGDAQGDTNIVHWVRMFGGSMFKDGKAVAGSDENVVKAMDKLYSWMKSGYVNFDAVTKKYVDLRADFQNQKSVMFSSQTQSAAAFRTEMDKGTIAKFDLRYATIPKVDNGKDSQTLTIYYGGAHMFNTGREAEIKEGKKFLSWYMAQDKYQSQFIRLGVKPASKTAVALVRSPEFTEFEKMEMYNYDVTGGVPGYNATGELFAKMMQSRLSDKQTSAAAAADYTTNANKLISEYSSRSAVLNK
jgi:multiple sugar transport system substrate-binding protein